MKARRLFVLVTVVFLVTAGLAMANGTRESASAAKVTLKYSDNMPDRTNGMRAVAQAIIDKFLQSHPNVSIETESYPDQPYQQKIKLYATAGQLPDIMKYWSFSTTGAELLVSSDLRVYEVSERVGYPNVEHFCRVFRRLTGRTPGSFSRHS